MKRREILSPSQEDYLEAIFHIVSEKQAARAKDIAQRLKVKGSSVTGALRVLAEKGLINYAPYDLITLTPVGKKTAVDVVRRHEVLHDFFNKVLGLDEAEAEKSACKMEHAVSRSVLDRLILFVEFLEVCPRAGTEWMLAFAERCDGSKEQKNCISCTDERLEELKGKQRKEVAEGKALISLCRLEPGQKGKIIKISGGGELRHQLIDKGFTYGSLLEAEPKDPLGERVEVKMKGYHLSLRKIDADKIVVEVVE